MTSLAEHRARVEEYLAITKRNRGDDEGSYGQKTFEFVRLATLDLPAAVRALGVLEDFLFSLRGALRTDAITPTTLPESLSEDRAEAIDKILDAAAKEFERESNT